LTIIKNTAAYARALTTLPLIARNAGKRSAYNRVGGAEPKCYPGDVTPDDIHRWLELHDLPKKADVGWVETAHHMAYQPGNYRIVWRRLKGDEILLSRDFWCCEPTIGYFQELARTTLLNFWKWENAKLAPIPFRDTPIPELMVITDNSDNEVCRWSVDDELAAEKK
jgi:hypothetical protein